MLKRYTFVGLINKLVLIDRFMDNDYSMTHAETEKQKQQTDKAACKKRSQ